MGEPPGQIVALHVVIERVHPLTGSVTCDAHEAVGFTGWLELLEVLSDLVDARGGRIGAGPDA